MAVWLGVDVGTVRVGVARSDATGLLASPLTTLRRDGRSGTDVRQLVDLAAEWEAEGVVVGLPVTLAGRDGAATVMARQWVDAVHAIAPQLRVEFVDERLTTVSAHQQLRASGVPGRRQRQVVDQVAATVLLQQWLDTARARR